MCAQQTLSRAAPRIASESGPRVAKAQQMNSGVWRGRAAAPPYDVEASNGSGRSVEQLSATVSKVPPSATATISALETRFARTRMLIAALLGLLVGALIGLVFARTRTRARQPLQIGLLIAIGVGLLALLVIPAVFYV